MVLAQCSESSGWMRSPKPFGNGRFHDVGCFVARILLQPRGNAALAKFRNPRSAKSRDADIDLPVLKVSDGARSGQNSKVFANSEYANL